MSSTNQSLKSSQSWCVQEVPASPEGMPTFWKFRNMPPQCRPLTSIVSLRTAHMTPSQLFPANASQPSETLYQPGGDTYHQPGSSSM